MEDNIIASRGFTNDNKDVFSQFIEKDGDSLFLCIEHCSDAGEIVIRLKISPELLKELRTMYGAALVQIKTVEKDQETFRNY